MREAEFKAWMEAEDYSPGTINTQMSKVRKLDRVFGDLDALHASGGFDDLEMRLRSGDDLPRELGNDGERGHLPTSLRYYRRFLEAGGRVHAVRDAGQESGMNEAGFRQWLEANYSPNTVATKLSEARQLAKAYGDLDELYDENRLEAVMESLRYSAADKAQNRPNPSKVPLTSDLYRDLSNLRTTVNYYRRYRGEKSQPKPNAEAVNKAIDECAALGLDAFLDNYGFGKDIDYWVLRDGERYPSKAVFGVAHQFMPGGAPLDGKSCQGTEARLHLEKLGFEIVKGAGAGTSAASRQEARSQNPTNLILYGPPGTGKTYATAAEAARLCGEVVPKDREELMAQYEALVAERRIAFVTFHQSFSYEDFVEGLRPVVPTADGEVSTAGFTLQAEPGIFRQIAERAQTARGRNDGQAFDLTDRPVYKMSLGEVADSASDFVFKEAVSQGYALLGFSNIDWSDPRFEEREEIFEAVQKKFPDQDLTPNKGVVRSPDVFRNQLQVGDVVIAAKGNYKFRAIGVVEGEYEYAPRPDGRYCHRRKVRWLWTDPDGRDVAEIYPPKFIQNTIYRLKDGELNRPALAELIADTSEDAESAEPLPHVLIIDEINRANISKVFGELITLLEPDKRLGMPNALTVRLPYSKREFGVPANLHIVGTMNTADRSIALLDTALRRRFRFKELAPDTKVEAFQRAVRETGLPLDMVLETINDRIEYLIDREHRIGHAFFIGCTSRANVDAVMRDKIIPLLQEYFFEDWGRVAAVLGERPGKGGGFLDCRKLKDPTGQGGEERESWSVRSEFAPDAYDRLIGKPVAVATEESFEEAAE